MTRAGLRIPDFFVVGAPKCGTTSMYEYLRTHPALHLPRKEIHYFGQDLRGSGYVDTWDQYLALFAGAAPDQLIGDVSVWYLYSPHAAEEIHAANPRARIVAMLRNPLELIPSLHGELRVLQMEPIAELREALEAERDRVRGSRLPPRLPAPHRLLYRRVARYAEQLERYLSRFGPEAVCVLLFDDFTRDPRATYERVLAFLGVPSDGRTDFDVFNPRTTVRIEWLQRSLVHVRRRARGIRHLVPRAPRHAVTGLITRLNTRPESRPDLPEDVADELREEFRDEVGRLSALIGRDLSHWPAGPTTSA